LAEYPGSLRGLAAATDTEPAALSRFKNGACGMSLATLDKIAPALGLSVTAKPRKGKRPAR
jgi:transcriptional regulator with XRE-family HTH domain